MKKIAIAALLAAFVAAPALADNTSKAYIAGDLGTATYSNAGLFPNPGMVRIAGGYHFSPMLAAEIGYTGFGDSTVTSGSASATLSASSFVIAVIGSLPLNAQFDLTAKLGMSKNSWKGTSNFGASDSGSQSSMLFGVGAQYHVNSKVTVRGQYEDYGNFDSGSAPLKATALSLGVVYNF